MLSFPNDHTEGSPLTAMRWRRPTSSDDTSGTNDVAELRAQLAGLESDAATIDADIARAREEMSKCEAAAMSALREDNEHAAREALELHETHRAAIETLRAELTLLVEMQQACRELLARLGEA